MSAFEEMGVMPELIRAIDEQGWMLPTPVQQEAVPLILGGGDVLAAAETGSGKTGAFALPVLQIAHESIMLAARGTGSVDGGRENSKPSRSSIALVRIWISGFFLAWTHIIVKLWMDDRCMPYKMRLFS